MHRSMVIRLHIRKPLEQIRKIAGGAGWWYSREVLIFDTYFHYIEITRHSLQT